MSGFKKSAVPRLIPITFTVETTEVDKDGSETFDSATVTHWFRRPTPAERERFADQILGGPRRKTSPKRSLISLFEHWSRICEKVEGYEDLDVNDPQWKSYFKDDIGMEHVQSAVTLLHEKLQAGEEDTLKR